MGDQAGMVKRSLPNSHNRTAQHRTGGIKTGIIEACDDKTVTTFRLGGAQHVEHAGNRIGAVGMALYRRRTILRVSNQNSGAGGRGLAGDVAGKACHGDRGIWVDNENCRGLHGRFSNMLNLRTGLHRAGRS